MKRLILLLLPLLFLGAGVAEKTPLEGTWMLAYAVKKNKPELVYTKQLLDFTGDSVRMIRIGDHGIDPGISMKKFRFQVNQKKSLLSFAGGQFNIDYAADSLTLHMPDESKLVFRKLNANLKTGEITASCFRGAFVVSGTAHHDSLCFINDTTLLYTGSNHINFPAKRWNILSYRGFQFLNIHDDLNPLAVITACTPDKISLTYYHQQKSELMLTRTSNPVSKEKLIGRWKEVRSAHKPPFAPPLQEGDQYLDMMIDQDSLEIKIHGTLTKQTWDITPDGKRIYFIDKIWKEDGSWKLLTLTDSTLTFRESRHGGSEEIIVKLRRER